jgi:predicted metal-dependent phosphoesterase TrpH
MLLPAVLLLAGITLDDGTARASKTRIVKHYTTADRASGRYQYVPFEVPPGATRLQIAYDYDRANGDNVVDLGLFEPGVLDLGTPAFRGYSGGARKTLDITRGSATPGYKPGLLPPGRWHVLLGLYKVSAAGVSVTVDIESSPRSLARGTSTSARKGSGEPRHDVADLRRAEGGPEQSRGAVAAFSREGGPAWYTGALHTHTLHSDGTVSPADLLRIAREAGFDFVAITDHNNTTHRGELTRDGLHATPLWIAGEEVTTPNGHASVWGLDEGEWVDFRVRAEDGNIRDLVSAAHRFGSLFSINHPASDCLGCGWTHEIPADVDAIEVSNGRHGEVAGALALWDRLLMEGRRIAGVGSSDWHAAPNPIDVANARVYAASLTENAILAGIRAGHVIVMNGAKHATPSIAVRTGDESATVGSSLTINPSNPVQIDIRAESLPSGSLVVVSNGRRDAPVPLDARGEAHLQRPAESGYVRFELSAADGTLVALSNPVYLVKP